MLYISFPIKFHIPLTTIFIFQPAAHNVFGDDVSSDSERSEAEPQKRQADSDDEGNKSDASRKSRI